MQDMNLRGWLLVAALAVATMYGWIPVCWAIGKLGGWC